MAKDAAFWHLEHSGGTKFYRVVRVGKWAIYQWGKQYNRTIQPWAQGQFKLDRAQNADSKIGEKLGTGYQEVCSGVVDLGNLSTYVDDGLSPKQKVRNQSRLHDLLSDYVTKGRQLPTQGQEVEETEEAGQLDALLSDLNAMLVNAASDQADFVKYAKLSLTVQQVRKEVDEAEHLLEMIETLVFQKEDA